MTSLTPKQIKAAVLKGIKEIAERFARDPTPTDGAIRRVVETASTPATGGASSKKRSRRKAGRA